MSETMQLGVLSGRRKRRTKPDVPIAQRLPAEILLQIFSHVPRIRAKPSSYITGQIDPMRHIPRVCKAWFQPATEILYKFVCVPRVAAAMLLHRTLEGAASSTTTSSRNSKAPRDSWASSHSISPTSFLQILKERRKKYSKKEPKSELGSLIKVLLLPKRVWVGCPERLLALFTRIIDLCDSLDEIQVISNVSRDVRFPHTLPRYSLPIPIGRHVNLKSLALSNAEARAYTNFPLYTDQFPDLESLCLSGFRISPLVSSEELKPLMKLRAVRLESCDIGTMEGWLMKCPNLVSLEIDLSIWNVGPGGGIFAQNTLTRLQWSRTSTPIDLEYIRECQSLEIFTTDYGTFAKQWKCIPSGVQDLTIIVKETDDVSSDVFSEFMEASLLVRLSQLSMRVPKSHKWIEDNQSWLEDLMKKKGVTPNMDLTKFGPLPVKAGSTLWQDSAQKIRRLTKPERASELDWEQQYRKKRP